MAYLGKAKIERDIYVSHDIGALKNPIVMHRHRCEKCGRENKLHSRQPEPFICRVCRQSN